MKKTLYTLSVNNYEPEITKLTFPLMKHYAKKIGAEFHIIKDRKFPDFPCPYEKFQISELSKKRGDEWSIFFDADALIHPNMWDPTETVGKEYTISNGTDFTPIRWKSDKYFKRDGRFLGKGNWCMMGSDWTAEDLWRPLDDLTCEEAAKMITPTLAESSTVVDGSHLVDDYTVSRNIARYGLQHILINQIVEKHDEILKSKTSKGLLFHIYLNNSNDKVILLKRQFLIWVVESLADKKETPQTLERLKTWDGSLDWEDLCSILPHGKKIAGIIKNLGIEFEYKPVDKLSYDAKRLMLMSTIAGFQDSKQKQEMSNSIHNMPKNASIKDFVKTLPNFEVIVSILKNWDIKL